VSAAGRHRPERTRRRLPATIAALSLSLIVSAASAPPAAATTPAAPATPATSAASVPRAAAGADLIRSREWPLSALHIPQAWRWSKGAGVTVAVLDTGVDGRHPDLVGRVIQGPDYTGHGRRPGSRYWGRHGTAMASIIAGHGHGPGRSAGMVGVAPQAKILSIRVTWENDDPERSDRAQVSRTRDAVAKGIRYAVDHGAQVINMSLGGGKMIYNGNPIEEEAVRYALGKGAMLIASAGNDGAGANRTNFPAAYPGVTAVGAVDKTLRPAKFTNRHDYVSVAAPGVDIISADVGRSYVQGTGTSPSAAIVAGIAALVRARCPALSPEQTRQALEEGTTHRPPGGRNTKVGAGVADALRAVYAGNRICKAPPPSQAAQPRPETAGAAVRAHANLPRIGFLGGGGLLLIVSLFMGWRQRRRRARETYDPSPVYTVDTVDTVPPPRRPGASARRPPPVDEPWPQPNRPPPNGPQLNGPQHALPQANRVPPSRPPVTGAPPGPRPGLLAAPIALPEPRRPAPAPERDFGDDPLGTGYIGPTFEVSTPLADQSWETVLRDRRRDGLARTGRPAEHESNGAGPPLAGPGGEPGGDPIDFPRFRRPPES
jgi:type VII secretion-associated serine protease mycosin